MSARLSGLLLLLLTPLQAMGQAPPVAEPDAISKRLIDAKEAFVKEMQSADRELLGALNEALSDATSEGSFDRAKRLTATKEAFEKEFLLPTDGSLGTARSTYHRRFVDARQAVEGVFDELVVEVTRAGDLKRGDSLRAEKERWLGLVAKRKTTKTRYQHPVPPDAVRWEKNGHYYKAVSIRGKSLGISWPSAKAKCEELGGYLACGETPDEMQFISKLAGDNWVGALKQDGKWVWLTGVELYASPSKDGAGFDHATTDGKEWCMARPASGLRANRTWGFICEWDE